MTGANLHVRSGSGMTSDSTNLGNVIVGYDGDSNCILGTTGAPGSVDGQRNGSHNLLVGDCHQFTASGGFLAGFENAVTKDQRGR